MIFKAIHKIICLIKGHKWKEQWILPNKFLSSYENRVICLRCGKKQKIIE